MSNLSQLKRFKAYHGRNDLFGDEDTTLQLYSISRKDSAQLTIRSDEQVIQVAITDAEDVSQDTVPG